MEPIKISVTGALATVTQKTVLTSGTVWLDVEFTFDEAWTSLKKTAVFRCGNRLIPPVLCEENRAQVPWEALEKPGCTLFVGVYGTDSEGIDLPTVWAEVDRVREGATVPDVDPSEPTPSAYEQTLAAAKQAVDVANSVREDADNGKFKGDQGEQGIQGKGGLNGDTPCLAMRYDEATGDLAYCVTYTTEDNEPDKTAIEIRDNTDADFLPEDYPAILTPGNGEYEGMLAYSVNYNHIPAGMTRKLINLKVLRNLKNAVLRLKIKYLSVGLPDGTPIKPKLFVCDVWNTPNVYGADYAVMDENGNPVGNPMAGLELGKWYTVYITANGDADFYFWPVWDHIEELLIEAVIKDVELLHHEKIPAYLISNSGNCAPMSLYKTSDGAWQLAYSSFYEAGSTANTAYYRRLSMKLDAADYYEARFDFMYTKSSNNGVTNCNLAADVPVTVVDAQGNVVANADRKLNTWYTAIFKKADGNALPKSFDLYPMGYADGASPGALEIEMQIRNSRAYKYLTTIKK